MNQIYRQHEEDEHEELMPSACTQLDWAADHPHSRQHLVREINYERSQRCFDELGEGRVDYGVGIQFSGEP